MTTPAAMRVGYWFALMLSFALAAAFVLTAAGLLPYMIAGQTVAREAWWRISPILPVVSVFAAAIAFGIRRRKPWVRHLVMLLCTTLALAAVVSGLRGDIPPSTVVRALIEPAVLMALCGWYFYAKPNVVEYFRAIGNETGSR
ncbi:MAG TPA: hypothetical protein VGS98_01635 [Thermoanaerobaculia bacterium]|jgi:hypothetical protein|nr:hypothetical protein [Thermoanaerobaculia bacterium]